MIMEEKSKDIVDIGSIIFASVAGILAMVGIYRLSPVIFMAILIGGIVAVVVILVKIHSADITQNVMLAIVVFLICIDFGLSLDLAIYVDALWILSLIFCILLLLYGTFFIQSKQSVNMAILTCIVGISTFIKGPTFSIVIIAHNFG